MTWEFRFDLFLDLKEFYGRAGGRADEEGGGVPVATLFLSHHISSVLFSSVFFFFFFISLAYHIHSFFARRSPSSHRRLACTVLGDGEIDLSFSSA